VSAILPAGDPGMRTVGLNAWVSCREAYETVKLPGLPVAKQDIQLANNLIPISTTGSPVFDNFCIRQVQHFAKGIIIGKGRLF